MSNWQGSGGEGGGEGGMRNNAKLGAPVEVGGGGERWGVEDIWPVITPLLLLRPPYQAMLLCS